MSQASMKPEKMLRGAPEPSLLELTAPAVSPPLPRAFNRPLFSSHLSVPAILSLKHLHLNRCLNTPLHLKLLKHGVRV
jgi:hypothetical protein